MLYAADGDVLQHLHLALGERAGGSHHNRFAGVNAQWVEILHGSNGEAAVVGIADALELNLLPSLERLFHQNLRGKGEGALGQFDEGFLVGADAAAQSAQCVGRTNHDGETDAAGSHQRVVHVLYGVAHGHLQLYLGQLLHKKVAVLGVHDGFDTGAQHLDAILLQCAVQVELGAAVEGCLSAEGQQYAVGALFLDDFRNEMGGYGLEVHLVGYSFARLDGGDVGVYQNAANTFFAQGLECLRARVVEFSGLSDFECAAAKHEHLL